MKIRAITIGTDFNLLKNSLNKNIGGVLKNEFKKEGIEVQTLRLCTIPFDITSDLTSNEYFKDRNEILSTLNNACDDGILNYYSYCPGMCDQIEPLTITQKKIITELPEMLHNNRNMFSSIQVSSKRVRPSGWRSQAKRVHLTQANPHLLRPRLTPLQETTSHLMGL